MTCGCFAEKQELHASSKGTPPLHCAAALMPALLFPCRWFEYVTSSDSPLTALQRSKLRLQLLVSEDASLVAEQAEHGDMMLVAAAEGYHNLWRKVCLSLFEHRMYPHAGWFVAADGCSSGQ